MSLAARIDRQQLNDAGGLAASRPTGRVRPAVLHRPRGLFPQSAGLGRRIKFLDRRSLALVNEARWNRG